MQAYYFIFFFELLYFYENGFYKAEKASIFNHKKHNEVGVSEILFDRV